MNIVLLNMHGMNSPSVLQAFEEDIKWEINTSNAEELSSTGWGSVKIAHGVAKKTIKVLLQTV